ACTYRDREGSDMRTTQEIDAARRQFHRRYLEDLRWVLTREYWKGKEADDAADDGHDLIRLFSRSYSRVYLDSLGEQERDHLFLIEEGLARVDNDDYAACCLCGEPIEENRLDAAPWTRHCAVCEVRQATRRMAGSRLRPQIA